VRTAANHRDKRLQQNNDPHNRIPTVTVMWKPKPRWNTGCPFALGLIVDGTIRTKQGTLISARDLPPSPPCFNNPSITLATKTTGEKSDSPSKPTFTRQLLEHKLHTLKMRYKRITQRRAKLMRAIRKTHRQKGQREDPYITKTQPQPRGIIRHTIKLKLNFFMTIPGTPDQMANTAVPWMLKPVEHNTFRPISDNVQLWTVTTTTEKQVPPNPGPGLGPSQASSTEEHNTKRNETITIDLEQHNGNDSNEYDSPSDDVDLHFKAQLRNPPEFGESNAESAERTKRVEKEVEHMKKQRQRRRQHR
jgi:hypothetical protein